MKTSVVEKNSKPGLSKDQLVTIEDLELFKAALLAEFKNLLKGSGVQPVKKWLKSHEVRKLLDVSPGKLLTLRVNGTLPFMKIGGVVYYDQDDIQQMFLSKKLQHPKTGL